MKKATKRPTRAVRKLSAKPLTAKQARGVKGGATKLPGRLKWENVTLKRGIT